ncbi:uncharacterized protein [Montipora capricornis]|uniref:uncharacterized protein n=1 Tax=Montipora capricornis TaxID=246305 RepID=UPI0035F1384C
MSDKPLNSAALNFSEDLLSKPPDERKEEDILTILTKIRHTSTLFKNLEEDAMVNVLRHAGFIKVKKDHVIVRQGDEGNCFFVILKGSVTLYARKSDEHHGEFLPHHEMGAVRSAQERLAYFGVEMGSLKSGRSFGEMVLMSGQKERNATVIADEVTELIIVNRGLYEQSFQAYGLEWKEKSSFALAYPLFLSWPQALKGLLIENLKMHKINFGNRIVEQGHPCNSVFFIAKGAGKVLSDPRKCKEQFEALNPRIVAKKRGANSGDNEEKIQLNAMEDVVRPLTVIEKRRRRIEHGFVAMETRLRQREIQATTIGPNDIIGDVEVVLDIPFFCTSVECVETLEVYELDKSSFQRLIARRSPETLNKLRQVVIAKLKVRAERFKEIPLFKYLFERAVTIPRNDKLKPVKTRYSKLVDAKPLVNRWQAQVKLIKAPPLFGKQVTHNKSDVRSKPESKGEKSSEKRRRDKRGRSERKDPNKPKQYTAEEFRALKKQMQAQGKMIGRVPDD